jgi:predicted metal-binding protein
MYIFIGLGAHVRACGSETVLKKCAMRVASSPRLHLFVCANRRDGSPLGPGCGERGDALYDALKATVAARRSFAEIWVTKTHCLGICPKRGATVARYPSAEPIVADVELEDVDALLAGGGETEETEDTEDGRPGGDWDAIERELLAIEELETKKVLDLARRLKPGLTMEDVQNPHDFPELDDPDWHYADGILTGIKSVTSAMRALKQRGGE